MGAKKKVDIIQKDLIAKTEVKRIEELENFH
jgi:hypothetical protein